jgi:hypothetical protein
MRMSGTGLCKTPILSVSMTRIAVLKTFFASAPSIIGVIQVEGVEAEGVEAEGVEGVEAEGVEGVEAEGVAIPEEEGARAASGRTIKLSDYQEDSEIRLSIWGVY